MNRFRWEAITQIVSKLIEHERPGLALVALALFLFVPVVGVVSVVLLK